MFKGLNTSTVINIGFGVILLILVIIASASIFIMSRNNEIIANINLQQEQADAVSKMQVAAQQRIIFLYQMTQVDDPFERDELYLNYKQAAIDFIKAFTHLRETENQRDVKSDWSKIRKLASEGGRLQDKTEQFIYQENFSETRDSFNQLLMPMQKKVMQALYEEHAKQQALLNNEINKIPHLIAYWFVVVASIIAILIALSVAIYVSRHNKRNRNLEIQKKLADEENIAKSEFLANMSHELRTPLHAILSFSQFGLDKNNISVDKFKKYFKHIRESADRLHKLVSNLLDLSKLESCQIKSKIEVVNLDKFLRNCYGEMSAIAEEKNITIQANLSDNLEAVECDESLICHAVMNLALNAIQFSNNNSTIWINVMVLSKEKSKHHQVEVVHFSIEDEGIGIPTNELDSIFGRFTQSSLTKTGSGGTGLGLAICAEIMKVHKGDIWAEESKNGRGARFVFEFPKKLA